MSATLSPRQVASVKQWLDEQPQSAKEKDEMTPVRGAHTGKHQHASHDRDFHVHSRMQQHSRMWHHDLDGDHEYDAYIDPGECFLRMCSACLASGALGVAAVTYVLVHATSPTSGSDLDNKLNWAIALPLVGLSAHAPLLLNANRPNLYRQASPYSGSFCASLCWRGTRATGPTRC